MLDKIFDMNFMDTNDYRPLIEKMSAYSFGLGKDFIEFKHVMEAFPSPILITTADIKIVYVNPAWQQLTGYSMSEVEGKDPSLLQSGKTPKELYKRMWQRLMKGKSFTTEDMINKKKSGREYQIYSTIFPVTHEGKTIFFVQVEQDITIRKKMDEMKREFLSTATHELRTPITTLKLLIQVMVRKLMRKEFNNINTREVQLIVKELDRLTRIIDDLSDVSRIDSGKLRFDMHLVDIASIITDSILQMQSISNGHALISHNILSTVINVDEDRIKQVLINLIKNALKYSYPDTDIVINTMIEDTSYIVSIQNNGPAIPKKQQALIFGRFYQLQENKNPGLGLGLYIARQIVEYHKGKIWVKSDKDAPTTFYFSLPTNS